LDIVSQGLIGLLSIVPEVSHVASANVRALEVSHKDFREVSPVLDAVKPKVL
jgi:hypothetical protein